MSLFILAVLLFTLAFVNSKSKSKVEDNGKPHQMMRTPILHESHPNIQLGYEVYSSIPKYAYATFIGSASFFPALEVFLHSFAAVDNKYNLCLCIAKVFDHEEIMRQVLKMLRKYESINYTVVILPLIPNPLGSRALQRWIINWTKIQLFSLVHYEKVLYVDLDVIFLRNTDVVFNHTLVDYIGTYDWGKWTKLNSTKMNGGVFLIKPSVTLRLNLLKVYRDVSLYKSIEAEQGLFNYYFGASKCCLPYNFNVQKTVEKTYPHLFKIESIFILHFTGEKPWRSWSTNEFRSAHVDKIAIQKLLANDQWDAFEYNKLHNLWKDHYFLAKNDEFKRLTIFQMYYKETCWKQMYNLTYYRGLRLDGPLRNKNDINASFYYTKLENKSYQLALGEFGGMIATLNYINETPSELLPTFVGFTSWREREKHNWKEGASIDWTKIQFEENTIYYWYSLYSDLSFPETADLHHKGMLSVMKSVIPFPLPEMKPTTRYIYGNYFITSLKIFKKYMESANIVLELFFLKYPLGTPCPYKLPTDTKNPELRCVGYFLERYINVWTVKNNVSLVYAVDEPSWRLK